MKKITLIAAGICLAMAATAQPNYRKSTIITDGGAQLTGVVDVKEWEKNPRSISFKQDVKDAEPQRYTVKDIRSFEVEGQEQYERYAVSISMDKVKELNRGLDTTRANDVVFLKVIRKGAVLNMYSYTDDVKTRYYIKTQTDNTPVELVYKKYLNPDNATVQVTYERYKNQLEAVARAHAGMNVQKVTNKLQTSRYNEADLSKIADVINNEERRVDAKKPSPFRVYAGAALNISKATYSGIHELANGATANTSLYPKIAVGVDMMSKPAVGRFLLRAELSATGGKYEIYKVKAGIEEIIHTFDMHMFSLNLQAIYNIYNTQAVKVYAGAGVGFNYSVYAHNIRYIEDLKNFKLSRTEAVDLNALWFGVPLRAGMVIGKRYEVYGQYNYGIAPITSYMYYDIKINGGQVGFNYLFR